VLPSNEGRGYVLRRIIRRAVRHGYQLGGETPFFYKLVAPLVSEMGDAYPELLSAQADIEATLKKEELRFAETLEQGLKIFEQKTADIKGDTVPGDLVFLLYDTYGFPADLTADVARERKMVIDETGFNQLMQQQRERARSNSQFSAQDELSIAVDSATEFVGYNHLKAVAKVVALQSEGKDFKVVKRNKPVALVLDNTPFYAEGGGQVGDEGVISSTNGKVRVNDCRKLANGAFVHLGSVESGTISVGDTVNVQVHPESRFATAANHSATHLLHAALKQVLGVHVKQKGSMVNPSRLRFDFSHDTPLTAEQLTQIETLVNDQIFDKHQVDSVVMPIDQAKKAGAEALFGEKYGDEVRVISISDFSLELCGGTHVHNTAEIGLFKIVGESGIAAGVRRIEALTRRGAMAWADQQHTTLKKLAVTLKTDPNSLEKRVEQLQASIKTLEADKKKLQKLLASGASGQNLESQIRELGEIKLLTAKIEGADKELLRNTIDKFRDKHQNGIIVLGAQVDGKVKISAGVSKAVSKSYPAGKLIQYITALVDGRGGGRPDMAEGGIPDINQLDDCLAAVEDWIKQQAG